MNECPKLGSGKGGLDGRMWVLVVPHTSLTNARCAHCATGKQPVGMRPTSGGRTGPSRAAESPITRASCWPPLAHASREMPQRLRRFITDPLPKTGPELGILPLSD